MPVAMQLADRGAQRSDRLSWIPLHSARVALAPSRARVTAWVEERATLCNGRERLANPGGRHTQGPATQDHRP